MKLTSKLNAIFCACLCAFISEAQTTEMPLRIPEISGAVCVTADNVNIRKNPDATSPKLVNDWPEDEAGGDSRPSTRWSNQRLSKGDTRVPAQGMKDDYYPVLGHSGDWTKILYDGYYGINLVEGWIKNSFINSYALQPFQAIEMGEYSNPLFVRQEGVYKNFCLQFHDSDVMMTSGLEIGVIYNNIAILPLSVNCYPKFSESETGIRLIKDEYDTYNISYGRNCAIKTASGEMTPDLSKLSDKDIYALIQTSTLWFERVVYKANNDLNEFFVSEYEEPSLFNEVKISIPQPREAKPRVVNNPKLQSINAGSQVEQVVLQADGTTLKMSFINNSGITQWNVNRDAYITCDATPGKRYYLMSTQGVYISPKPTNISGRRGERISFSMTFEPVPLNAKTITLVEGPERDNFHVNDIDVAEHD